MMGARKPHRGEGRTSSSHLGAEGDPGEAMARLRHYLFLHRQRLNSCHVQALCGANRRSRCSPCLQGARSREVDTPVMKP